MKGILNNLNFRLKMIFEIEKDKVLKLATGTVYYVYNPLTDSVREEVANPIDIVHNKHCYDKLIFFIKWEE